MTSSQQERDLFPRGNIITSDNFKGTTWLHLLVTDPIFNCPVYNVTFEAGARNSWHTHPGGQILLVTGGAGLYQERGKPARKLSPGDVVTIPPDIEHWHGAAPDSRFSHIGITANPGKGEAVWLQPVGDEEYFRAAE